MSNKEFTLHVKEGDTLSVPLVFKQNKEALNTSSYTVTAYILNKVIVCQNLNSTTKLFNLSAEQNTFIDGTYTLYLIIEKSNGNRRTLTGELIVQKGKIHGQS